MYAQGFIPFCGGRVPYIIKDPIGNNGIATQLIHCQARNPEIYGQNVSLMHRRWWSELPV